MSNLLQHSLTKIVILITLFSMSGCNLGAPITAFFAAEEYLWKKPNGSEKPLNSDIAECRAQGNDWEKFDTCMLSKGYIFNPKPPGYPNQCGQLSPDRFACRFVHGEYILPPFIGQQWR